jgi:hypothetical protein
MPGPRSVARPGKLGEEARAVPESHGQGHQAAIVGVHGTPSPTIGRPRHCLHDPGDCNRLTAYRQPPLEGATGKRVQVVRKCGMLT